MIKLLVKKWLLGLGALPVLSYRGSLKGCWWSLYPQSSYWRGSFEPELTAALVQMLPSRGGCCWDLGAHFGYYSILMAKHVGAEGQVISLEPNPSSFHRLQRHCKWNHFSQIIPFPLAASDQEQFSELINYSHSMDTAAHLAYPNETRSNTASYIRIETVRMEGLLQQRKLRIPDLIKIDVEGHGAEALRGCGSILSQHRPSLIFSVHDEHEYTAMTDQLKATGYEIKSLSPRVSSNALAWPGDYSAKHSEFLTSNF